MSYSRDYILGLLAYQDVELEGLFYLKTLILEPTIDEIYIDRAYALLSNPLLKDQVYLAILGSNPVHVDYGTLFPTLDAGMMVCRHIDSLEVPYAVARFLLREAYSFVEEQGLYLPVSSE